jgi:hypothetical protein
MVAQYHSAAAGGNTVAFPEDRLHCQKVTFGTLSATNQNDEISAAKFQILFHLPRGVTTYIKRWVIDQISFIFPHLKSNYRHWSYPPTTGLCQSRAEKNSVILVPVTSWVTAYSPFSVSGTCRAGSSYISRVVTLAIIVLY